jgi:hypothetical protein
MKRIIKKINSFRSNDVWQIYNDFLLINAENFRKSVDKSFITNHNIYDKYNNVDDFANVFPMRNFSMLGIVTTAEMKYGSFFSDHCDVTLTFIPPEHDIDVYLKLTSQDNTEFIITTNEQQKSNSNTCSVDITEKTIVNAEYDNVKMFESITSILAIIAIMAVVLVMIYIAKRK